MSKGIRILALVASIIGAGLSMAVAQELRGTNQVPGLLGQAADEITITNTAKKAELTLFHRSM